MSHCHRRQIVKLLSLRNFAASASIVAIKELREKSGAPISEVKAALEEAKYNSDEAFQVLRKRGLAAATKKASRHAAEGLIGLALEGKSGALVEINSETDFVARNEQFCSLVLQAAQAALRADSHAHAGPSNQELNAEQLGSQSISTGKRLSSAVQEVAGSVRENICLRRAYRLSAPNGILSSYLHVSPAPGLGKIGTLVALESKSQHSLGEKEEAIQEAGKKLAMHAAAARPLYLDRHSVPGAALEAEKNILREQAAKTGRPANIIEKMILGRLNKFYEEACFVEQALVMDDSIKVKDLMNKLSREVGAQWDITGFIRVQCGEGLEEQGKKDFASEVKDTIEQAA